MLPTVYQPKKIEKKIYKLWLKSGFFNPDKLPKRHKKPYCILIPPPNITGSLHIGHALNSTVQDILIRKKRLEGFKTLWIPGIDHAGIATQWMVEKELKKEGKTRFDLGRKLFLKRIWDWKKKYGNIILDQLKKLGVSCDWSRTRFTMDKEYRSAVKKAFFHYYKKGWIYQKKRVINWCPRCQTSLSDLELEYKEEKGKLWYIKYPFKKIKDSRFKIKDSRLKIQDSRLKIKDFIVVATTRPETMLGDAAVAVNPKDKRYKKLIGKEVILPLVNRAIPIIADRFVDPKFGTGAVKVTPAHSLKDYEVSLRHNLPIVQVIDTKNKIIKPAPLKYQGLKVLEAREKIVEDLKKQNLLEKIENYTISVPKCYRCGRTIEIIPSEQWFLKMEKLAGSAIEAVKGKKIEFQPKGFEKIYLAWLENIRDWCISRQIWWGHQLPIWLCQMGRNPKSQIPNPKPKEEYFISLKEAKKHCKKPKRVNDVLDTWFSSALWPLATLGWPEKTKDLKRFYPSNVLSTDRGIINLWVARMVFSGLEFMKKVPFKKVYIHPTVLTKEGKRMSKSLGTGIDPINLVEKYGADATRFGIAYQIRRGQDIKFGEDNIIMGKKFCNKIWNASRFALLQIEKSKIKEQKSKIQIKNQKLNRNKLTYAERVILKKLNQTIKSVDKDLENFQFGKAAHTLYDFFWHDFCDKYIEKFKSQISKTEPSKSQKVLLFVLLTSLKLLHPFLPFITEEIYQKLPIEGKKESIMIEQWPGKATIDYDF